MREYVAGDQLQDSVQHWLSAPDPSTNQNFVSEARRSGTAAWFFESKALAEWKATGSFLWIHGKRMFQNHQRVPCSYNNSFDPKAGAGKSTLLYVIASLALFEVIHGAY